MGLDVVELVLQCEEQFHIELEDDRLEHVRTVGDLFEPICKGLHLPTAPTAARPASRLYIPAQSAPDVILTGCSLSEAAQRDEVWRRLVGIVIDQLQVDPEDVTYTASFAHDLGAD